jgi:hypothetical protein
MSRHALLSSASWKCEHIGRYYDVYMTVLAISLAFVLISFVRRHLVFFATQRLSSLLFSIQAKLRERRA